MRCIPTDLYFGNLFTKSPTPKKNIEEVRSIIGEKDAYRLPVAKADETLRLVTRKPKIGRQTIDKKGTEIPIVSINGDKVEKKVTTETCHESSRGP